MWHSPVTPHTDKSLSIVVPCYNEASVLPLLEERLSRALTALTRTWEVILVDDGSTDLTWTEMVQIHKRNSNFKVLSFSRNFGHQPAISAGLMHVRNEIVAIMDADLQDPPEILGACLAKIDEGFDVVYAVRRKRKESIFKRLAYAAFYRLLSASSDIRIPLDAGDFCIMTRQVVDVLVNFRETHVFMRGLRAWVGFKQTGITYERSARAAGNTKYPFFKLLRLASDGIFSFSTLPLRVATGLGFFTLVMAMASGMFIVVWRIAAFRFMGHTPDELPGWSALAIGLLFFSGVQLLILGFIGEYVGRIYGEVKRRPRWITRASLGLEFETLNQTQEPEFRPCESPLMEAFHK